MNFSKKIESKTNATVDDFAASMKQLAKAAGLQWDGGGDNRLYTEDMIFVDVKRMSEGGYDTLEHELKQDIKGKGYIVYAWNDASGYDYWSKDDGENYIQVSASIEADPNKVDPAQLRKDVRKLYDKLSHWDNTNVYAPVEDASPPQNQDFSARTKRIPMSWIDRVQANYSPMLLTALHEVLAARKDKYLAMLNKTSDEFKTKQADDLVDWSIRVLERDDRINWFLKRARASDAEYRKKDQAANKIWADERAHGMAKEPNPIGWLKGKIEHFIHNAVMNSYGLVLNHTWKDQTSDKLFEELKEAEDKSFANKGQNARYVPSADKAFLKLDSDWQWQFIDQVSCEREGRAMQHCGNKAGKPGDTILSLRKRVVVNNKEVWEPHATFIFNKGALGEMKGFNNKKPTEDLHPYILKLLADPRIERLKGGGYLATQNFKLKDLSEANRAWLEKKRPDLFGEGSGTDLQNLAEEIEGAYRGAVEYHQSEENWSNYLVDGIEIDEYDLRRLDDYVLETIEELKTLTKDWKDELIELCDTKLGGYHSLYNEIASTNIGSNEDELQEDLADQIDKLTDEQKDELGDLLRETGVYISDDFKYFHVGAESDRVVFVLNEDELQARVDELREAKEIGKAKNPKAIKEALFTSKHTDVRLAAVEKSKDQKDLEKVAVEDKAIKVRTAATSKLTNQDLLKQIAEKKEEDQKVREAATALIKDDAFLQKLAEAENSRYQDEGSGGSWAVINAALHTIKNEAWLKEKGLEEGWNKSVIIEKVNDQDYLNKMLTHMLDTAEKAKGWNASYISEDDVSAILKKLDSKKYEDTFKRVVGVDFQRSHWRSDMKAAALFKIADEKFLMDYVDKALEAGDKIDSLDAALKNVKNQDWLWKALENPKFPDKEFVMANIKDIPRLAEWVFNSKADEYTKDDYGEKLAELTDDFKILQRIVSDDGMWPYKRRNVINKITDVPLLKKLAADEKLDEDMKESVEERLLKLGEASTKKAVTKKKKAVSSSFRERVEARYVLLDVLPIDKARGRHRPRPNTQIRFN